MHIGIGNFDMGFRFVIKIGDWLGFGIEDWGLVLGIGDWALDLELGLRIWIGDWDRILGLGIMIRD